MITQTKISLLALMCLVLLLMTSCSDEGLINTQLIDTVSVKEQMQNATNRTQNLSNNKTKEETRVSISVVYTGDLDKIMLDETSTLYQMVNTHNLNLQDPFEIDEDMKGIILTSYGEMDSPVSIAKQISNSADVLMVEVKNLPNHPDEDTI